MRFLTLSLLLLAGAANAATYYVSTTGNDTNGTGAAATPWASLIKAVTVLAPGDTVLVQPGMYSNTVVNIRSNGTASDRITIRAAGPVTNWFGIRVYGDYVTLDGFNFHSGAAAVNYADGFNVRWMARCDYPVVTNCVLFGRSFGCQDPQTTQGQTYVDGPPRFGTFTSSGIYNVTNGTVVTLFGQDHLVEGCVLANAANSDVFRMFGTNMVVRGNVVTNIVEGPSHVDIIQVWGQLGGWLANSVFEDNYVANVTSGCQFGQFTEDDGGLNVTFRPDDWWGLTVRNNVFVNCGVQMGITIPNFKLYNNTFTNCAGSINWSFYDPESKDYRGSAHGGFGRNNALISSTASMGIGYEQLSSGNITADNAGGSGRTGFGRTFLYTGGGKFTSKGWVTNLSGTISAIEFYQYSTGNTVYSFPTNIIDSVVGSSNYWYYEWTIVETNGFTVLGQYGLFNGGGFGVRIKTDAYPDGEVSGPITSFGISQVTPPMDVVISNNFSGSATTAKMVNLRPTYGSSLIDAGVELGATTTHDGSARPLGAGVDIGAYEFDPSLLMHLDFDRGFTNASVVEDVTGYGRHGIGFRTNNWIVPTNGIFGGTGAMFRTNGWATNGLSRYETSQYLAVTNVTGLTPLTNMTVSFWAENIGKTGSQKLVYMLDAAARNNTNSWRIGRLQLPDQNRMSMRVYKAGTTDSQGDLIGYWPANTKSASDLTTTNGLELYTVTIDCSAGKAVFYLNGTPRATNTITVPSFSVSPGDPTPWICVGAHKYGTEGSYYWGDDGFPNDAYHNGSMDDIRIYNRTLTATEVASLYAGQAGASIASTPQPEPEPEPVPPAITAQSGDVHIARGATVTLSVTATGTAPFTYQWSKNGVPINETSATMTLQGIDSSAGYYWCVVSNAYGSVTSTPMTVTVEPAPTERQRGIRGNGRIIGNGRIL